MKRSTPESYVVKAVMDLLAAERIFAFRLNTAAFSEGTRFFRSHSLGKGAADILALPPDPQHPCNARMDLGQVGEACACMGTCHLVRPLWIECKTDKGRQSENQQGFQAYVESLGHRYLVVRDAAELRAELQGK